MAVDLRRFTPARVALGRIGHSVPTAELLRFQLDHARARDAVHEELEPSLLGFEHILVSSAANDRLTYVQRPDLGRKLAPESRALLQHGSFDAAFVIADGLSALAVHRHAGPLLQSVMPVSEADGWNLAPVTVVRNGRVAVGDEIGELLGAKLVAVLIGERPGLQSPDSLGVYVTWEPRPGRTDAERNCISNIRAEGLSYQAAAARLHALFRAARERRLTGIKLRDRLPPGAQ